MEKQIEPVMGVPVKERTKMLSFRVTPTEQRRVRLHAVIAGVPICCLMRDELAGILTEDPMVAKAGGGNGSI